MANRSAHYDIYYLDQSWIARFADDTIDPREKYWAEPALAMPDYDWDDFLPALVDGISIYRDKMVGIPFDIPLFIMFYRRDLFEELAPVPDRSGDEASGTTEASSGEDLSFSWGEVIELEHDLATFFRVKDSDHFESLLEFVAEREEKDANWVAAYKKLAEMGIV